MTVQDVVYNKKQNELFHKNWGDYHLKNTSVYNIRIKHVGDYILMKRYHGHMLKSIYTKDELVENIEELFGVIDIDDKKNIINLFNEKKYSPKGSISDEIRENNYHRSHELLIELTKANYKEFKSFITLTFAENIQDIDVANKEFNNYCLRVRKLFPEFKFLGVPERQKRGAIHYHFMCNIVCGEEYSYYTGTGNKKSIVLAPLRDKLKLWNKEEKRYVYVDFYNLPFWTMGFSSAFNLDMTNENFDIAKYLSKYFWKNKDDSFFGRKKILRSLNLNKSLVEYFNEQDETFDNMKAKLDNMTLLRDVFVESKSKYCPDISILEYKKNLVE